MDSARPVHIAIGYPQFKLLQLSDPHLYAERDRVLRGTCTDASFAAVLEESLSDDWSPDLIVLTGDIAQDERPETYRRLAGILAGLNKPVLSLPGNHDHPTSMSSYLDRGRLRYCRPVTLGDWRVVPLSSHAPGRVGGQIGARQMSELEKQLGRNRYHAVFLHHHPLPMHSAWLDTIGLGNAEQFLDTLDNNGNVRAVFWGHVHQASDSLRGDTLFASTPSTCTQFLPGSERFAVDTRPPGWRRIALNPDGSVETEVRWLASNA